MSILITKVLASLVYSDSKYLISPLLIIALWGNIT